MDNKSLRERSGSVNRNSRLVAFLYELMRDDVCPGRIEELIRNSAISDSQYTNGYLANYAIDVANRLEARSLACCKNENRNMDGRCDSCGDPCI